MRNILHILSYCPRILSKILILSNYQIYKEYVWVVCLGCNTILAYLKSHNDDDIRLHVSIIVLIICQTALFDELKRYWKFDAIIALSIERLLCNQYDIDLL